jgi:hypothetical protein
LVIEGRGLVFGDGSGEGEVEGEEEARIRLAEKMLEPGNRGFGAGAGAKG